MIEFVSQALGLVTPVAWMFDGAMDAAAMDAARSSWSMVEAAPQLVAAAVAGLAMQPQSFHASEPQDNVADQLANAFASNDVQQIAPVPPVPPAPPAPDVAAIAGLDPAAEVGGVEQAMRDLAHVERLRSQIGEGSGDLWRFHGSIQDKQLQAAVHAAATPVVTFANTKGGVGKTTLVANMAAYFSKAGLRVLVIDLDDRAALTQMLLQVAGLGRPDAAMSEPLIAGEAAPQWLMDTAIGLDRYGLQNISLVTSGPRLRDLELRLFVRWLLESEFSDIRTHVAHVLADPGLRQAYDIVLIDTPPHRDLAYVNAMAAATHLVMPVIPDGLSIANIADQFNDLAGWVRPDLNPNLKLAGVVLMKTSGQIPSASEAGAQSVIARAAHDCLGIENALFQAVIPNRAVFTKCAGNALAYQADVGRNSVQESIDAFAAELVHRLT